METILRVARAPLTAAIAHAQLSVAHQASKDRLLLEALLRGGEPEPEDPPTPHIMAGPVNAEQIARETGWHLDGSHVAVSLRPLERETCELDAITPGLIAAWQELFPHLPLIPRPRGWVTWFTGETAEPALLGDLIRRRLIGARIPIPMATGIGQPATGIKGLRQSVAEADLAAEVASRGNESSVELYGELGPRVVLARLPLEEIAEAALVLLADLAADPRTDVLVETLGVLLDCAGSTGQAASRLGVHRNTVLGRIERIRACGVDPDAPEQRLALHVACYALRSTRPSK
ncbi:PucR family transcriptional regulator [Kitasatospora indigofera]|uniref:PucR family transcriptional regulator n=1 Tax=Kitasatospora indigofera TaxID=67307 RepID=UPI0036B36EF6